MTWPHPLASPPHPFHNPPMSLTNDLTSFAATAVRLGRGVFPRVTAAGRPDPPKLLELYDFEGCPYCRKTREVLCELDLDYLAHPVARGARETRRQDAGAVPRRPQHRHRDVRVGRHHRLLEHDLRRRRARGLAPSRAPP